MSIMHVDSSKIHPNLQSLLPHKRPAPKWLQDYSIPVPQWPADWHSVGQNVLDIHTCLCFQIFHILQDLIHSPRETFFAHTNSYSEKNVWLDLNLKKTEITSVSNLYCLGMLFETMTKVDQFTEIYLMFWNVLDKDKTFTKNSLKFDKRIYWNV